MHGPQQEGGLADPVGQGRAIQVQALPGIDLGLTVERKMIGVFRDEDVGNRGLRRDAALDEPGGRRLLLPLKDRTRPPQLNGLR